MSSSSSSPGMGGCRPWNVAGSLVSTSAFGVGAVCWEEVVAVG